MHAPAQRRQQYGRLAAVSLCLGLLALSRGMTFASDEWPQFRGPDGQGHSDSTNLPLHWSEQQNIKWKTAIPGQGWSSPVISDGQIWMTTASDDGKSMRAICVARDSGKLRYDVAVFTNEVVGHKNTLNSYASPSPIIEKGRLYVHFGTYGTAALSAKTGQILWANRDLKLDHEEGPGSSPALYRDKLLIPCDGTNVQYVAALDKFTGKVVWQVNRSGVPHQSLEHRKAFYTPLIISVDGRDQAIIQGANRVWSYEPQTGKEIWSVHYDGYSGAPRQVFGAGLIFICTGFERSQLWAIRPSGQGDITSTQVAWRFARQAPKKPSILFEQGNIFMINDGGIATCVDATTGGEVWRERIGGEILASPICAAHRIYLWRKVSWVRSSASLESPVMRTQSK